MGVLVTWTASAFDLLIGLLLGPMLLKYVVSSATGDAMAWFSLLIWLLGGYIFVCFLPITRESIVCCVLTAYWLRIDRVLNRSQICHKWGPGKSIAKQYSVSKWPGTQIFSYQVTHRLEHSVPRWPGDSNVQSLGGPETRKFSLWVPPRDSNMQSSRDPEEGEEEGRRVWL